MRTRTSRSTLVVAAVVCLILFGMLSVGVNSVNGPNRNSFADSTALIQLSSALEQYRMKFGELPPDPGTDEFDDFVARVYGEKISVHPQMSSLDRNELLTFLLNEKSWPIDAKDNKSRLIFYEFESRCLMDIDSDGWLEYHFPDGRMFVLRKGEPCLWNAKTNRYQFADW